MKQAKYKSLFKLLVQANNDRLLSLNVIHESLALTIWSASIYIQLCELLFKITEPLHEIHKYIKRIQGFYSKFILNADRCWNNNHWI